MSPVIAIIHSGKLASCDNATRHRLKPYRKGSSGPAADCDNHPQIMPSTHPPARVSVRRPLVPEPPPYSGPLGRYLSKMPVEEATAGSYSPVLLQTDAGVGDGIFRPRKKAVLFQFIRIG